MDALRAAIALRHPRYADRQLPSALDEAFDAVVADIEAPMSRAEGFRLLGQLNPSFEDAHTVLLPLPEEAAEMRRTPGRLFPFPVRVRDGRLFVEGGMRRTADGTEVAHGLEISAINDMTTGPLLDRLARYGHGETPVLRQHMLRVMFEDWLFAVMGWQDRFKVVFANPDGSERVVETTRGDRWEALGRDGAAEAPRVRFLPDGTAYLRLATFDVDEAPEVFERAVDEAFAEIRARAADRLILDVRGNTGGQSDAGAVVLRHLVDRPIVQVASAQERLHEGNNGMFGYKGAPGETVHMALDDQDRILPLPAERRFDGRVAVLMDSLTYSAGILFATSVRDHRLGTLVGGATGGFANQTGNMEPFTMPNSGLTVYIPARIFVRPSGDARLMPLEPDVAVDAPATFDERDAVIAAAVAALARSESGAAEAPQSVSDAFDRIASEADTDAMADRFKSLWGIDARVPILLHDDGTGVWSTTGNDDTPHLVALRGDQPGANTCLDAQSSPRVLLMLPLPERPEALAALVWHERWHCAQPRLGFDASEADTSHLATEAGRIWLRLELRALARALAASEARSAREAARHALTFRARRSTELGLGLGVLREEARVERNEGLAEYTGRKVAEGDPVPALLDALRSAEQADSFVRSAAYSTGPAYGLLLDRWGTGWRQHRGEELDLSVMLANALAWVALPQDAESFGQTYRLEDVRAEEARRAAKARRQYKAHLARFVTGAALNLPLRTPSVYFDPRALFPLGRHGTVYSVITVRDDWGELTADEGALLATDWSSVSVGTEDMAGGPDRWRGKGWSLSLSPGWSLSQRPDGSWAPSSSRGP